MQRSIRYQIVGLVGVMLIGALATYLVLANSIVGSDKLSSLKDVTRVLARTAAQAVEASLGGTIDKLQYFARSRPDPATLFDDDDHVWALQMFDREDTAWVEQQGWVSKAAPKAVSELPPMSPLQLDVVRAAGAVVQNVSANGLPLARLAISTSETTVVAATFDPSRLLAPAGAADMYRVYVVDASGTLLADKDAARVLAHTDLSGLSVVKEGLHADASSGEREYELQQGTFVASWARTAKGQLVVVAEAPREEAFRATRELTTRALAFGAVMILVAIALAVFFSRRVSGPLQALQGTMARVAKGELGAEVEVHTSNELGQLAESFNQMSRELAHRSEELDRKNQQLVQSEKMSAIGELSAGLAHEVKNPMVGIVGFAQLGQESTSLEEAREYFKLIDNDAQRANGILQNLLEFARPPDVEQEVLEFNQVVAGAVKLTAHQLQLNGVRVHTEYADGLPKIRGNGNQLRQVLLNLMMNASQAMEGSKDKHLYVQTKGGDAGAQVSVRDVGPGIPADAKARIFEPFFTTKPRGKGTGLGLSVSRSIIEAHRGELRVESELGKGATFFIRLPSADEVPETSGPFPLGDELKATRH